MTVGARTVERLAAASAWRRFAVDASGDGWVRLADRLADPAGLDAWYEAELVGPAGGHRDLAGALIVYRFAGSLAELVMGPLLDRRRVLLLSPANLSFLLAAGTRIDALSVASPAVALLPDDPEAEGVAGAADPRRADRAVAGDAAVVVADRAELHDVAADGLCAVFEPLADAVRARAPFGLRGMWGTLADHVAEGALSWAREHGGDRDHAWSEAEAVIDAVAARQPLLRVRPRRHPVPSPAGEDLFADKGTCCLIYKVHELPVSSATGGAPSPMQRRIAEAACASCPLRSRSDRHNRFSRYLAQRAAGSRGT